TDPGGRDPGFIITPGNLDGRYVTLRRCIRSAYSIPDSRIIGAPAWADEDHFQIDAKAIGPAEDEELMTMLQGLLADRFKLAIHKEHRPAQGYALSVNRGGIKLKPSSAAQPSVVAHHGSLDATGYSMPELAKKLSDTLHVPIEDKTKLSGRYDFKLEWSPEMISTGPTIFKAVQGQLGLSLQPKKISVELIVIDHVERPTPN